MTERTLIQFPISHYCEKTRWNLDAKGLRYRVRDVLPGVHRLLARRHGTRGSVPILVEGDRAFGDSTEIAMHLEATHPEPALLPRDEAARARALELEAWFDDVAGPAVRRWMYGTLMREPGAAARVMFAPYPRAARMLVPLIGGRIEGLLRRQYRIDEAGIERSRGRVEEALARIEELTFGDPARHLVGDAFGLADLTAASLLAPLIGPSGTPWSQGELPESLVAARENARARPAGRWILRVYTAHRGRTS